jgi:branched-chain amino acid transport system substrate-binding protein
MKHSVTATAGGRGRRRFGPPLALAALALLGGCYFVIDRDGDQCSSDGDCSDKGGSFAGYTCDESAHLCVKTAPGATSPFLGQACTIDANCRVQGSAFDGVVCGEGNLCTYQRPLNECQTNAECTQRNGGELSICRRPDRRCVPVKSEDCAPGEPLDALQDPNVVLLGTLLTNRGEYQESGLPLQNAVALAAKQIRSDVTGLPGGPNGTKRPLGFIFCHEGDDPERAARHLTDTLRVPAIVGASISDFTIDVANKVTIPSGVLLVSPGATSISISSIDDRGLLWRTAPSDVAQSGALARLGEALEARIRADLGRLDPPQAPEKLRLALIAVNDAYGSGLASALVGQMTFNGSLLSNSGVNDQSVFITSNFDLSDQNADEINTQLEGFEPHIVVLAGSSDVATKIIAKVDPRFTGFKPYYLLADGAFGDELVGVIAEGDARGLRERVRITAPGSVGRTFDDYLSRYNGSFDDDGTAFGAAGAYDATYLLALGIASLGPSVPVTGDALARALVKTADTGAPNERTFDVRFASDLGKYLTIMASGGSINYVGASGPLDFDTAAGEAPSDIKLFCPDTSDPPQLVPSGQLFEVATQTLTGTESCVEPVVSGPPAE